MIPPSFSDKALDRDIDLIRGWCGSAHHIRKDLRDWIQAEVIALCALCDAHAPLFTGIVGDEFNKLSLRLRVVDRSELGNADKKCAAIVDEILNGGYEDVVEAHAQLQTGYFDMVQLVTELNQARQLILSWTSS